MPQLSPDQLDDVLQRAGVRIDYSGLDEDDSKHPELDERLAFLHELNAELAKDGGQAGTHAYDMMAAVEEINAGNTAVLIELIAGVVLSGCMSKKATAISTTFSPADIDEMQKRFDLEAKRDGMQLTVTLRRLPVAGESWLTDATESGEGAKPQAEATGAPERPVWALRDGEGTLFGFTDRGMAKEALRHAYDQDPRAHIENRFCLHPDCPSTGCNRSEATSET